MKNLLIGTMAAIINSNLVLGLEVDSNSPMPLVSSHLLDIKPTIENHLSNREAELHFFWTTGRTLSDNMDYQPNTKVDIGGSKYSKKIFPYVNSLLENSPSALKVKFILDTITEKSNQDDITLLQNKYSDRLEILRIENIQKKLLEKFPEQSKQINILFQHATQGNPVIASDVYRLIGMIYGQDEIGDITNKHYSYCDIDTFCEGMESDNYAKYVNTLFAPVSTESFYIGRVLTNNDIIKLQVNSLEAYNKFCELVLSKIDYTNKAISHFSYLHDQVKKCEENPKECANISELIAHYSIENLTLDITLTTGPKFLGSIRDVRSDLDYKTHAVDAQWTVGEERLNYKLPMHISNHPSYAISWIGIKFTEAEETALKLFEEDCENYRKILGATLYAKIFGKYHPFNVKMREYLINEHPINNEKLKQLLQFNFEKRNKDKQKDYSIIPRFLLDEDSPLNEDTLYIEKEDNRLKYILLTPEGSTRSLQKLAYDKQMLEAPHRRTGAYPSVRDYLRSGVTTQLPLEVEFTERSTEEGYLDIDITPFNERSIRRYNSKITEEARKKGLIITEKGLTLEEWKDKVFKEINGDNNYYSTLAELLKELDIEIPFKKEYLDFVKN